jgi:hypothetical protein
MAIKRPGAKRPAPLGAGTKWRMDLNKNLASRCKGGFPAGGRFLGRAVAASRRGLQPVPRSDQPIWTAGGAPHIPTDQELQAMMDAWIARGIADAGVTVPLPYTTGHSVPVEQPQAPCSLRFADAIRPTELRSQDRLVQWQRQRSSQRQSLVSAERHAAHLTHLCDGRPILNGETLHLDELTRVSSDKRQATTQGLASNENIERADRRP